MGTTDKKWVLFKAVTGEVLRVIDEIALSVATANTKDAIDFKQSIASSEMISFSMNSLGSDSFRAYFTALTKTLSFCEKKTSTQDFDSILESLFIIKSLIEDTARSEYEPLQQILNAIEPLSVITNLTVSPALFIPNNSAIELKRKRIIEEKPEKLPQEKIDSTVKRVLKDFNLESATEEDLLQIFNLFHNLRQDTTSTEISNYYWGCQLLIAQIVKGKLSYSKDNGKIVLLALKVALEPNSNIPQKAFRNLCTTIVWNGVETPELYKFAESFGIDSILKARIKELKVTIEPPIMCIINGPIRDQIETNIQRVEYWGSRLKENEIAEDQVQFLVNQIVNVSEFVGVPLEKLEPINKHYDGELTALYINDLLYWFDLVQSGQESSFSKSSNNFLISSKIALTKRITSSIDHCLNRLFKGKGNDLIHVASSLLKIGQISTFLNKDLSDDLNKISEMAAFQFENKEHRFSVLYSNLVLVKNQLPEVLKVDGNYVPVCEKIDRAEKPNPIIQEDKGVSFRSHVKSLLNRFKEPTEDSIFIANVVLRILLDSEVGSEQRILDSMAECDQVLLDIQNNPGDLPYLPDSALSILKEVVEFDGLNKEVDHTNNQNKDAATINAIAATVKEPKEVAAPHSLLGELPVLTANEGVSKELFAIFQKERTQRHNQLNQALINKQSDVIKRQVHSLAGIHRQLGYTEISLTFKSIENLLDDTDGLPENINDLCFQAFQMQQSTASHSEQDCHSAETEQPVSRINDKQMIKISENSATSSDLQDTDFKQLFIEEVSDHVSNVQKQIDRNQLNRDYILRVLHTIKGSALMAGYDFIADKVHGIEDSAMALSNINCESFISQLKTLNTSITELIEEITQPAAVLSTAMSSFVYKAKSEKLGFTLSECQATEEYQDLESALVGSGSQADSTGNSVTIDSGLIGELLRAVNNIENSIISTASELNRTASRSTEQKTISERQYKACSSLSKGTQSKDYSGDLLATDTELTIKSIREDAIHSRTLALANGQDVDSLRKSLEAVSRKSKSVFNKLNQTLNVNLDSLKSRMDKLIVQCSESTGINAKLTFIDSGVNLSRPILRDAQMIVEHIVRNAFAHGFTKDSVSPEIIATFIQSAIGLEIVLSDNGNGINLEKVRSKAERLGLIEQGVEVPDAELQRLILHPGFSTSEAADQLSGRGVGMDVVYDTIMRRNGRIDIDSVQGEGTEFRFVLTDTSTTIKAVLLGSDSFKIAVPLVSIATTQPCHDLQESSVKLNDKVYRVIKLSDFTHDKGNVGTLVFLKHPIDGVNVVIHTKSRISIKPLTPTDSAIKIQGILGYASLLDGSIASIIDPYYVIPSRLEFLSEGYRVNFIKKYRNNISKVLVVDDSAVARSKIKDVYERYGFTVDTAENAKSGIQLAEQNEYALISTDFEMPFATGIDMVKSINKTLKENIPPIFMITSRSSERHKALSEKAGIDVFISKGDLVAGVELGLDALQSANRIALPS